jgi:hypothetical protein
MEITDQEVLTKNGVIDSMGIFRLVAFLEEEFNVRVGDEEITHDNLESIDAIERPGDCQAEEISFQNRFARGHRPRARDFPTDKPTAVPQGSRKSQYPFRRDPIMHIGRKVFTNGFKVFDLFLMVVSFALATLPQFHRVGRFSLAEFFELRIKLGNLVLFVCFLAIWYILFSAFSLYSSKRMASRWDEIWDISRATTLGSIAVAVFGLVFRIWLVNRVFLVLFWVLTTTLMILSRMVIREVLAYLRRHGKNTRNMLVIGTNARALELVDRIQGKPELGYRVLGFADEDWHGSEEFRKQGHSLVSDLDGLPSYLRRNIVDEVVLALPIRSFHTYASKIAAACEQQGIVVRFMPNIFDLKDARQRAEEFDGDPLISHETTITDFWGLAIKRGIDIMVSLTAIIFTLPRA